MRKKKQKKKYLKSIMFAFTILVLVSFLYLQFGSLSISNGNSEIPQANQTGSKMVEVDVSSVNLTNELILVNSTYGIDDETSTHVVSAFNEIPLSASNIEMNHSTLLAVNNLFEDAKNTGFNNFFVLSGFRSVEEQRQLFNNASDKSYVQKPGFSEHQTGLAVDIAYSAIESKRLGESQPGKWLMENVWKYGLILRYPDNKTDVTGISYEPWHYRYVGIPHAYYCYTNNMCLEEYLAELRKNGSHVIKLDGLTYTVYYQKPIKGLIQVPVDADFDISGDNRGGYIITVKEQK